MVYKLEGNDLEERNSKDISDQIDEKDLLTDIISLNEVEND